MKQVIVKILAYLIRPAVIYILAKEKRPGGTLTNNSLSPRNSN